MQTNEIQEIIDFLKDERSYYKTLPQNKTNRLLDYITNLQEENKKFNKWIEVLNKDNHKLQEENERLNNIINEIEKDINNEMMMTRKFDEYNEGFFNATLHFYNKLKELKEGKE